MNPLATQQPAKLLVFIDGWCAYCTRFAGFIQRIDTRKSIHIKNIRQDKDERIDEGQSLKSMASISLVTQHVAYGYESLYRIACLIPLLWVFLPLAYLLKVTGCGEWLYRELAIRRKIIPLHCHIGDDCLSGKK